MRPKQKLHSRPQLAPVLTFRRGEPVQFKGKAYTLIAVGRDERAVLECGESGETVLAPIGEIQPWLPASKVKDASADVATIDESEWRVARKRYAAIEPLLGLVGSRMKMLASQAKTSGTHPATLYRWRNLFAKTGTLSALLPKKRGSKEGTTRLSRECETIIAEAVEEVFLTKQKATAKKLHKEIERRCHEAKVRPPHYNTIRARLAGSDAYEVIKNREGSYEAELRFLPVRGSVYAVVPLSVVQMDHTLLNVIVVDDESRMPIGRPWFTVVFDICTRVVLGFYLSLDPPGALSAGLCLARGILRKDQWLRELGVSVEWPFWGLPAILHMDNAKEFRGEMIKRACSKYDIESHFRPVKRPNWGGHIERYMRTLSEELKALPGATFRNPEERGKYQSEKTAALTLRELEKYLVHYICGTYHQSVHSALGRSPQAAWQTAIFGDHKQPGLGLPMLPTDPDRLKFDFMPFTERTISEYGVRQEGIHYFADVLRPYINRRSAKARAVKGRFLFRYDPRDISRLYFQDPTSGLLHPIPYRDTGRPAISLWELRAAKRHLKARNADQGNEEAIFATIKTLRDLVDTSVKETKRRRRDAQRQRMHRKVHGSAPAAANTGSVGSEDLSQFKPYSELESR